MARPGAFYQRQPDGLTLFGIEGEAPEDMVPAWGPEAAALEAEIDRDRASRMTAQADPSGAGGGGNVPEAVARDYGPQGAGGATAAESVGGGTVGGGGEQLAPGGAVVPQEAPLPTVPTPIQARPGLPAGAIGAATARAMNAADAAQVPAPGMPPDPGAAAPLISDESATAYEYINRPVGGGYTPSRPAGWVPTTQSMQVTEALPPDVAMGEMGRAVGRFDEEDPARLARAQGQAAALDAEAMARQAEADRIREDAAAQAAFRREVQAEYERRVAGVNEQRRAVAERKVDPQRFFRDNGTLGNILLVIGAGLTAGGGGDGLGFIERIIDRDIAEQQRQIQEEGAEADNALADLMRRYGYDIEEASQTLAIMQGQAAASEGQALAASAGSGEAMARYQAWADAQRAALAEREDKLRREMAGKAQTSLAQKWDPGQRGGYSAPRAPTLDEKIARAKRFPGLTPEQQATGVSGGVSQVGQGEKRKIYLGTNPDGSPVEVVVRDEASAELLTKGAESMTAARKALSVYREGLLHPEKLERDPAFAGEFRRAMSSLVRARASMDQTQAPTATEMADAEQYFPKPRMWGLSSGERTGTGRVVEYVGTSTGGQNEEYNRRAAEVAAAEIAEVERRFHESARRRSAGRAPEAPKPVEAGK